MIKSDQINDLAAALSKAQGEMPSVPKRGVNKFFNNSKYVLLDDIIQTCLPVLSKHGLSVSQIPEFVDGKHVLTTILMHSSGQYIGGVLNLIVDKNNMQGLASAITYACRQGMHITGVSTDDDDDANEASGKGQNAKESNPKEETEESINNKGPTGSNKTEKTESKSNEESNKTTGRLGNNESANGNFQRAQQQNADVAERNQKLNYIYGRARKANWTEDQFKSVLKFCFNVGHPLSLNDNQYKQLISFFDEGLSPAEAKQRETEVRQ